MPHHNDNVEKHPMWRILVHNITKYISISNLILVTIFNVTKLTYQVFLID